MYFEKRILEKSFSKKNFKKEILQSIEKILIEIMLPIRKKKDKKMKKEHINKSQISFENCKEELKKLISKKELYFTRRCNKSIELSIGIALSKLDPKKERFLLIQEEGGWLTYRNYAKKHKLTLLCLKMSAGRIIKTELQKAINISSGNAILIMHSLPGYSYAEDMSQIKNMLSGTGVFLINDCCGSIGTDSSKVGDIIVCSFGEAKPLSAGGGGFIAADNFPDLFNLILEEEKHAADIINFQKLHLAIYSLKERLLRWRKRAKEVKTELTKKGFAILNVNEGGINVLVGFSDEEEKERLINYCKEKGIEYTECPRYIRTNKKALSLEIKRLL